MTASIRTEWGRHGLHALNPDAAVIIIIDVLSFCTAVDIATARGATIIPFRDGDQGRAQQAAASAGAICATRRNQPGAYNLSPASLLTIDPGTSLLLPSPNGATLTLDCAPVPIFAACLRNASAVAHAASTIAGDGVIAVIPAGERWPDDTLRPALEDWLGAGAVIDALDMPLSPESAAARASFRAMRHALPAVLAGTMSGQELIGRGYPQDVDIAAAHDVSACVPRFDGERYRASEAGRSGG